MIRLLSSLARNEDGATLVEYAIVVSLIAIVGILAVTKLGDVTASHIGSAANGI
jgi:Flp pilus assembly pilin Flp